MIIMISPKRNNQSITNQPTKYQPTKCPRLRLIPVPKEVRPYRIRTNQEKASPQESHPHQEDQEAEGVISLTSRWLTTPTSRTFSAFLPLSKQLPFLIRASPQPLHGFGKIPTIISQPSV